MFHLAELQGFSAKQNLNWYQHVIFPKCRLMQQFESPVLEFWRNIVYIYIFISYSISILCMHARMCGYNNMYTMCNYKIIYIYHMRRISLELILVRWNWSLGFCFVMLPCPALHSTASRCPFQGVQSENNSKTSCTLANYWRITSSR